MTAPLLELIDRVCEQIATHQGEPAIEGFATVLLTHRTNAFAELPGGAHGAAARAVALRVAAKQLALLAELPPMIQWIAAAIQRPDQQPALELMQVAALAYLVNPGDLLPDDLPAGYGFIDDAIVLRATIATLPQIYGIGAEQIADQRLAIDFHGLCIPRPIAPALVQSVHASVALVHMLGHLPPALLQGSIERLLHDPLAPMAPQGSPAPAQGGWGMAHSSWFRLPEGVLEQRADGAIRYRLHDETGVLLVGSALSRG